MAIQFFEQSIDVACEIGHVRNEGVHLGNLGDSHIHLGRWGEAEDYLVRAIEICRRSHLPAAGAFMGSLAWVYTKQSKMNEAQKLLKEGEPLNEVYPLEHGKPL